MSNLQEMRTVIRSLLVSVGSRDITLSKLNKLYFEAEGEDIPFKDYNYTSLREFLKSMPDVLHLKLNKSNDWCAYHIDTENTEHITRLKSKENVKSKRPKHRSQVYHVNPINPTVLFDVLQKSKKSFTRENGDIIVPKSYVLDEICKQSECTTYTMRDLNSQLYQLTHLLSHNEVSIKFKNRSYGNIYKRRSLQKSDIKPKKTQNINEKSFNSTRDLIKDDTIDCLRNLIKKYPEGILCSELPKLYQKENKFTLEYMAIGFSSIIEFIGALPDVFQMITPKNGHKYKVFDASMSLEDIENYQCAFNNAEYENCEDDSNIPPPFPNTFSTKAAHDCSNTSLMKLNDTVGLIDVASLKKSEQMHVIISEALSPSFFWITLAENQEKLVEFMIKLQNFYDNRYLNQFEIPEHLLQRGLNVACKFADVWHRGIIRKVKKNGYSILLYDYGTIVTYKANELYFLNKQFSKLTAQAILCSLYNVKPINNDDWPIRVMKEFSDKVLDKKFIAVIKQIDIKHNSIVAELSAISRQKGNIIPLCKWMLKHNMCVLNTEEDFQKSRSELIDDDPHDFIDKDISTCSSNKGISNKEKLLILQKYKDKLSNSRQSSSSNCSSITEPEGKNEDFIKSRKKDILKAVQIVDLNVIERGIDEKTNENGKDGVYVSIPVGKIDQAKKDTCNEHELILELDRKAAPNNVLIESISSDRSSDSQSFETANSSFTDTKDNETNKLIISKKSDDNVQSKCSDPLSFPKVGDCSMFNTTFDKNNALMFKSCDEIFCDEKMEKNNRNLIINNCKSAVSKSSKILDHTMKELNQLIKTQKRNR